MNTGNYDCYLQISIVTHRRISVQAATLAEATSKAEAIAAAWMPAELIAGGPAFPAHENPAIVIEAHVIRQPHDVAPEDARHPRRRGSVSLKSRRTRKATSVAIQAMERAA